MILSRSYTIHSHVRICVCCFKLHLTAFLCRVFDGFDLIYTLYYWKITSLWRSHYPCPSWKGSSSFPSAYGYRLTDVDIRTRTDVVYPVQVNGLIPFTDMGKQTWTGVAWPLVRHTYLHQHSSDIWILTKAVVYLLYNTDFNLSCLIQTFARRLQNV